MKPIVERHPRPRSAGDDQGWDVAEFLCGQCSARIVVTTEREYVQAVMAHRNQHAQEAK